MKIDCILLLSLTLLSFMLYTGFYFFVPLFFILSWCLEIKWIFPVTRHGPTFRNQSYQNMLLCYIRSVPAWKQHEIYFSSSKTLMQSQPFYLHPMHTIIVHQYDLLRHWGSNNLVCFLYAQVLYAFICFFLFLTLLKRFWWKKWIYGIQKEID